MEKMAPSWSSPDWGAMAGGAGDGDGDGDGDKGGEDEGVCESARGVSELLLLLLEGAAL